MASQYRHVHHHHDRLDRALETRNFCVVGLSASWFVGIAAIGSGAYCLWENSGNGGDKSAGVAFVLPHITKEALPLGMNIIVTLLNESMGYIHSTALRWSLQRETRPESGINQSRLTFNSNLRLLSNSDHSRPNKWYSNMAFLLCIVLSYATTSLIFLSWNPPLAMTFHHTDDLSDTPQNLIKVSGVALVIFGLSLLGQAILSTWALVSTNIPTWSSNPLDTVSECTNPSTQNQLARRPDRCMKSVHDTLEGSYPIIPRDKQRPACTAHPQVKYVLILLWILVPLGAVWGGSIYTMIIKGNPHGVLGDSWNFLPLFTGDVSASPDCVAASCTDGTSVLNVGWTANSGIAGSIGSIFLIAAFQSMVTLALHCAELIVNLSRDEAVFRKSISKKGTDPRYSSILAACKSWQTLMLFAFKAAVHWLFGLSINNDFKLGVNMYPPQIFYFTAFALAVAIFATFVSLRKPVGMLPATFGHLQTLADLIDDWDDRMFWGHKRDGVNGGPNYAGTDNKPLPKPKKGQLYGGVRPLSPEEVLLANGVSIENLADRYWKPDSAGRWSGYEVVY